MSNPALLRHDNGGITTLTLNQADQFNVLSHSLLTELIEVVNDIKQDSTVRVVVLTGSGKVFCSGHNLKEMRQHHQQEQHQALFELCTHFMLSLHALPQPVIAQIQGIATAAGCQLVAMCDLAVATESAKFAVSGINLGLFCSTPAVALSRNIGRKKALQMLLTGEFISANEALDLGLINQVVPTEQLEVAVTSLARRIMSKPAQSIAMGKALFYGQIEAPIATAYQEAVHVMATNMMLPETTEGIEAFMQKRQPNWAT